VPIRWTGNAEADRLLEQDPLALLIGLVLDQQVRMEHALSGPYELKRRLGKLDAAAIAAMDPDQLDEAFRRRPALHRFPGTMARRVQALCEAVQREYGGDAARVWTEAADGADLGRRIRRLPGFGDQKARILVSVLAKKFGVRPTGWEREAASWHTLGDVDSAETMEEARRVKRQMKADAAAKG
jgi:uncharacterized HhH-GPD family protein